MEELENIKGNLVQNLEKDHHPNCQPCMRETKMKDESRNLAQ